MAEASATSSEWHVPACRLYCPSGTRGQYDGVSVDSILEAPSRPDLQKLDRSRKLDPVNWVSVAGESEAAYLGKRLCRELYRDRA